MTTIRRGRTSIGPELIASRSPPRVTLAGGRDKLRPSRPSHARVLMPPISSDALVLRTYKLGETSKVVVLLTRERGKVRAVAKGARGARPRSQAALEPLPAGERRYHRPAHGFVCEACGPASGPVVEPADHDFLREAFARPPAALARRPSAEALEAFHRDLIRGHLERDLHSHRVLRDVAREMRG